MYHNIKALILNCEISSEADKIITAYTDKWGKINAIVPGAKKIVAKLSAATEPVTESELIVYQNSQYGRPTVTGAKILNNNTELKQDFNRMMLAFYVNEISAKFAPVHLPNLKKYELISRTWQLLVTAEIPIRVLTAFSLRLLKLSGYNMIDYLNRNYSNMKKEDIIYLKKISNCCGDDLDTVEELLCNDDKAMWGYVESYLKTYISQPSVGIFLRKINYI
ncbi:DNA repair protein RecO [Candidatus Ruminimicrobium bovinum]|uniref:DNA repair protein RecO n=1 Tax=Candidatus Ruminimicrobium bovinum TaxID=3242779 RepID=UPI0039B924CD